MRVYACLWYACASGGLFAYLAGVMRLSADMSVVRVISDTRRGLIVSLARLTIVCVAVWIDTVQSLLSAYLASGSKKRTHGARLSFLLTDNLSSSSLT